MGSYAFIFEIVLVLLTIIYYTSSIEDSKYWNQIAADELKQSLIYKWNENVAKNVILFIGDGMSIDTTTASRIYRDGETSYLAWEKLPHVGLIKTYNTNKKVADSASTATALFSGVKTNYNLVGVDSNVQLNDCDASLDPKFHVSSIIEWAQKAGKDTGFVTTTRVTHATPAPLYAHSANRKWECENTIPENLRKCKDIARQLIENTPGKNIKVIMGGGRQMLQSNVSGSEIDPTDTWACYSTDGRDLINDWIQDKKIRNFSYQVVKNNKELKNLNPKKVDYVLGIFANGHLKMDWERSNGPEGQPSLEEMTNTAIQILNKSSNGYLLVVEGGLIDYAHHRGHAAQALRETVRLSDAVNTTLKIVDQSETLIIVTSDHSHSMTFNGYPDRNSSILGLAQKSKHDGIPFTTLSYSTGGPNNIAYTVTNNDKAVRIDPRNSDTFDYNYSQQAGIITDEAYHGGGDVAIYAQGPFAHLIHSTHEQNYVAYVIGYAAQIGPYFNSTNHQIVNKSSVITFISLFVNLFYIYFNN